MGLLKAGINSLSGTLADQWKEFFYCDAIENNILVVKGQKRIVSRSSNIKGNDNIISNGSGIVVADGQCMMIVDQGKMIEFCAQPGEYTFDSSSESSFFAGSLGEGIDKIFETMKERMTYGGSTPKDQRVYYFNLKEITNNKYGTVNPIPFRVVDEKIGLDIDISIKCHGVFSYKITNPILFYKNVCGNISDSFSKEEIASMLKGEILTALQPAFAKISQSGIRYSSLPAHTQEIVEELNQILDQKWSQLRGIQITSFTIMSIIANKEDEELIKNIQKTAIFTQPSMAAATLVEAQSSALKIAAANDAGSLVGLMGINAIQSSGSIQVQDLYQMSQQENIKKETKKIWVCSCGTQNTGQFRIECGKKKPEEGILYRCDKCGWQSADLSHPPKFCPECGDGFDEKDK